VPAVHELRDVGKNMQDHYVARVSYPVVGAQTANERQRGLPFAGEGLEDIRERIAGDKPTAAILAWLNRTHRLAKDFEASIASAKAWLFLKLERFSLVHSIWHSSEGFQGRASEHWRRIHGYPAVEGPRPGGPRNPAPGLGSRDGGELVARSRDADGRPPGHHAGARKTRKMKSRKAPKSSPLPTWASNTKKGLADLSAKPFL